MLKLTLVTSSTFSDLIADEIWLCFSGGGAAVAALLSLPPTFVSPVFVSVALVSPDLVSEALVSPVFVPAFWSVGRPLVSDAVEGDILLSDFVAPALGASSDAPDLADAAGVPFAAAGALLSPAELLGPACAGAGVGADWAGAAVGEPPLAPGLWAATNPQLPTSSAADINNFFLISISSF